MDIPLPTPLFMNVLKSMVEAAGSEEPILRNFKTLITLLNLDFSQTSHVFYFGIYLKQSQVFHVCPKPRNVKIKTTSSVKQYSHALHEDILVNHRQHILQSCPEIIMKLKDSCPLEASWGRGVAEHCVPPPPMFVVSWRKQTCSPVTRVKV